MEFGVGGENRDDSEDHLSEEGKPHTIQFELLRYRVSE
jgi:hypothetical protein